MTTYVHPEVRNLVIKEYHRMRSKYHNADGQALWQLARDYVWTLALADTANFKATEHIA